MQIVKAKQGDLVARRQDKVMEWYLIQTGSVTRHYNFAEITMGANSIIGILEDEWFSCDYVASEDTTLIVIPCKNADDLQALLRAQANFRPIFLRTALEQRHQALCLYADLKRKATLLHTTAQNSYNDYKTLCSQLMMPEHEFYRLTHFEAIKMQHKVEKWELNNSQSLMQGFLREYLQLMIKNDSLCVGAIMEVAAQMHRMAQGIEELADYLMCNRDILWNDTEDDIFHLYMHLAADLASDGKDLTACQSHMKEICEAMKTLNVYETMQIDECTRACSSQQRSAAGKVQTNIAAEDCVAHIMSFAGYDKEEIRNFKLVLQSYKKLPDRLASDKDTRTLRKTIGKEFYKIYKKAFFNSMQPDCKLSPIMQMFFNFGFMDAELLGEEQTQKLVRIAESLGLFQDSNIFTMYEWLKRIYTGEKDPSRNEFDLDYSAYLREQLKQGNLTERDLSVRLNDQVAKVEYEIDNLFQSTHKSVSGRPSTFCPLLCADDMLSAFEKMASTATRINQSINSIRSIDYSVLYREVFFSDPEHGINQEGLMKEVMPDVILLPCIGSRSAMWQETSGPRTSTPARFIFPIFMSTDLDEQMLLTMGRYRWEICRRVQGGYWNDFRVKSLTSEYYDYLQFYRKNKELSADTKEKLKTALLRARNNFREVFVMDYTNWIRYESQGSFRLNKMARDIFVRYCPFSRELRDSLANNPLYQNAFGKLELENQKHIKRLQALYTKYQAAGGEINADLNENLRFYQM